MKFAILVVAGAALLAAQLTASLQNDLGVAAATLSVAARFDPMRRRILRPG